MGSSFSSLHGRKRMEGTTRRLLPSRRRSQSGGEGRGIKSGGTIFPPQSQLPTWKGRSLDLLDLPGIQWILGRSASPPFYFSLALRQAGGGFYDTYLLKPDVSLTLTGSGRCIPSSCVFSVLVKGIRSVSLSSASSISAFFHPRNSFVPGVARALPATDKSPR